MVSGQLQKTYDLNKLYTWARLMVMWYWSANTLFWQFTITWMFNTSRNDILLPPLGLPCDSPPPPLRVCRRAGAGVRSLDNQIFSALWECLFSLPMVLRYKSQNSKLPPSRKKKLNCYAANISSDMFLVIEVARICVTKLVPGKTKIISFHHAFIYRTTTEICVFAFSRTLCKLPLNLVLHFKALLHKKLFFFSCPISSKYLMLFFRSYQLLAWSVMCAVVMKTLVARAFWRATRTPGWLTALHHQTGAWEPGKNSKVLLW